MASTNIDDWIISNSKKIGKRALEIGSKKYKDAKNYLQTAVQLMPADPVVNDHYGDALWKNGNKIQARYYWNYVINLKKTKEDLKKTIKNKLISGL